MAAKLSEAEIDELGSRVWITKDQRKMKWSEMTPAHLTNAANFLATSSRNQISSAWSSYCSLQGEMAQYYAEQEIDSMEDQLADVDVYVTEMRAYAQHRFDLLASEVNHLKEVFGATGLR